MNDYLDMFEKFKYVKGSSEIYNEVLLLRTYHNAGLYQKKQEHLRSLMSKYYVETCVCNAVNTQQPSTYEQSYINAENFLCAQGAKIIINTVINYAQRLDDYEKAFIKHVIKTMGVNK